MARGRWPSTIQDAEAVLQGVEPDLRELWLGISSDFKEAARLDSYDDIARWILELRKKLPQLPPEPVEAIGLWQSVFPELGLDAVIEKNVPAQLARLKCTRIVIAHRLSMVAEADRLLVLDQGRVIEHGTHREMLSRGGAYQTLVAAQVHKAASA